MKNQVSKVIVLDTLESSALAIVTVAVVSLLVVLFRRRKKHRYSDNREPDWSIPVLDAQSDGSSFFHSWHPSVKVGTLCASCFLIVSLNTLTWSLAAVGICILAVLLARTPWERLSRRLVAISGFLAMLVVLLPFTSAVRPEDTVFLIFGMENWPFHQRGLIVALTIVCKAVSVVLLMEPMLATAPFSRTLQGFSGLGLPRKLLSMIALCHRYLFVFREEILYMQRAMRVRGFVPRTNLATMRIMGNCFGMLFIRSFERTERIYEAMLSRGYRGSFPAGPEPPKTVYDFIKAAICLVIALLLLSVDRIMPSPLL
ncbi:MAG: cobalt ECF transporter T component CbiQ [Desulfobulbus sp.]|nr:cobalt ECF transporter T component CbiQ [Desulfobulbus sp.]